MASIPAIPSYIVHIDLTALLSVYRSDLSAPLGTSVHWFATYVDYLPQRYVHSMNKSFVLDG